MNRSKLNHGFIPPFKRIGEFATEWLHADPNEPDSNGLSRYMREVVEDCIHATEGGCPIYLLVKKVIELSSGGDWGQYDLAINEYARRRNVNA